MINLSKILLLIILIIIIASIAGWANNVHELKSFTLDFIPIMPLTIFLFFLLFIIVIINKIKYKISFYKKIIYSLILILLLFSIYTLIGYLFGLELVTDKILFRENEIYTFAYHYGRLSSLTAFCFLLTTILVYIIHTEVQTKLPMLYIICSSIVIILSMINIMGYFVGIDYSKGIVTFTPMAINTSLLFILFVVYFLLENKKKLFIKLNVKKNLLLWLMPILSLFIFIFITPFQNINEQVRLIKEVEHTLKVQNLLYRIKADVLDVQKSTLNFLITNDKKYYDAFNYELLEIFKSKKKLDSLIIDNIFQKEKFNIVKDLIFKRIEFSNSVHNDIILGKGNNAEKLIKEGKGYTLVSQIKTEIDSMVSFEERLLNIRSNKVLESQNNMKFVLIVILNFSLGLMVFFFIVIKQDLDLRERLENKLNKANSVLNEQVKLTKEANKELEAFSYSVSHDLRAPLRHIAGYIELLKKNIPDKNEKIERYLKVISTSSVKMGNLIDDLLTFSRIGRTALNYSQINSNELINEIIASYEMEVNKEKLELNISELPIINGDRNLIKQVWWNLISNALKYSKYSEIQKIEISFIKNENQITFYIKDNGVGFNMNYYDKLFGVFQRLHNENDFEGTGIGLANIKRIINKHDGKIWAESQQNIGTTFYFTIPN